MQRYARLSQPWVHHQRQGPMGRPARPEARRYNHFSRSDRLRLWGRPLQALLYPILDKYYVGLHPLRPWRQWRDQLIWTRVARRVPVDFSRWKYRISPYQLKSWLRPFLSVCAWRPTERYWWIWSPNGSLRGLWRRWQWPDICTGIVRCIRKAFTA